MSAQNKVDMSLDQIIKLQRKGPRKTGVAAGRGGRGGRSRAGAKAATRLNRQLQNQPRFRNNKIGISASLASRRLAARNGAILRNKRPNTVVGQRVTRNLLKRALVQSRRQAIVQRRQITAPATAGASFTRSKNQLVAAVRHWRTQAQQLQQVLLSQNKRSPLQNRVRRGRATVTAVTRRNLPTTDVKQRLGWRGNNATINNVRGNYSNRGSFRARGRNTVTSVKGRGTVGQMQSDVLLRQEQTANRRQQQQIVSRVNRQQKLNALRAWDDAPSYRRGGGLQVTTRSPGRRFNNRPIYGNNTGITRPINGNGTGIARSSFSTSGTNLSLNDRFGGGRGTTRVRVAGRNAGRRQIYF